MENQSPTVSLAAPKPDTKSVLDVTEPQKSALPPNNLAEISTADIRRTLAGKFDLREMQKTSVTRLARDTLEIHLTFIITGALLLFADRHWGILVALAILPFTMIVNARALRGAEHYVHEGCHGSVMKITKGLNKLNNINDLLTDLLFATFIIQTVADYRASHMSHHRKFGSEGDPCKRMRAGLAELAAAGNKSRLELFGTLISVLPVYCVGYYREVGSRKLALWRAAAAHTSIIFTLATGLGFWTGLGLWIAVFVLPFVTVLQGLRALGEASEHDYGDPQLSEGAATYNNLGWVQRTFVNPFGDSYHWIHHEFESVPSYRYVDIHNALQGDPLYSLVRTRTKILEQI